MPKYFDVQYMNFSCSLEYNCRTVTFYLNQIFNIPNVFEQLLFLFETGIWGKKYGYVSSLKKKKKVWRI